MEHISSMLSPVLCAQLTKLLDFNGQFYRQTFAKGFFNYYFFNSKLLGCKTVWAPETISRIGRPCSIASRYAEHRRTQETDYDMLQPRKWCGLEGESPKMALSIFKSTIWSKLLARYTDTSARLHLVPSAPLFPTDTSARLHLVPSAPLFPMSPCARCGGGSRSRGGKTGCNYTRCNVSFSKRTKLLDPWQLEDQFGQSCTTCWVKRCWMLQGC